MPTPQIPSIPDDANVQQLRDAIIGINRYLNYLLSSLDTLNINRLDAKVIVANTITADKIAANTITANEIAANTITANEIAANTITANEIAALTITANEIAANAIIASKILAGEITADKMNVTQLSAISANLGTITAGSITSTAEINVGTDATIGNKLFLNANNFGNGIRWGTSPGMEIYIDPVSESMFIIAPGVVNINGTPF